MPDYNYIRKTARYNGKKYEATGKTELEALTKLAEKLAAAKNESIRVSGKMTVSAWYKEWKETYKDPKGLTPKSLKMYDEKFNGYIKPRIGSLPLESVTDVHLQRILNEQAGKSASHVQKLRMVMQQLFRRARQSRLIQYDPAELLELPKVTKGERRSITDEERKAILAVAETHRAGLWVLTLLYTGMRPGETAALKWGDIDFEANEIHVRSAVESGSKTLKGPKTSAGHRDIPIRAELARRLQDAKKAPSKPVFPNAKGNHPKDNTLQQWWHSFRRALDIYMGAKLYRNKIVESKLADDLTPYCLRHTFATDAQDAGVPINVTKELMGHSDISVTANIYTHKNTETLHTNVALMDKKKDEKKDKKTDADGSPVENPVEIQN